MFYTDEAENSKTTNVVTMQFYNVKTEAINQSLDKYIDIIDAELFAIEKAIEFYAKKAYSIKIVLDI